MAEHTNGPWAYCPWGRIGFELQGGGQSLAIVNRVQERFNEQLEKSPLKGQHGRPQPIDNREEAEANARLMAAAPHLLKAVDLAIDYLVGGLDLSPVYLVDEVLRPALDKATGQEPPQ